MKFYLGTSLLRFETARKIAELLKSKGLVQTFDWTRLPNVQRAPVGDPERVEIARQEIIGIREADFVVILLPGGKGTHAELGAALGLGKKVLLHAIDAAAWRGDSYVCAFYDHPLVRRVEGSIEWLVEFIEQTPPELFFPRVSENRAMNVRIVYVAGPFRGLTAWDIEQNVRRAEALGLMVACAGAMPLIPHANTRFFQGQCSDDFWLAGTLEMLRRCDAMVTTEGWERSSGARAEVEEMKRLGRPVFHDSEVNAFADLTAWIKKEKI